MSEKCHDLPNGLRDRAAGQAWPVDQDDRKPEDARGVQLCPRAAAAGVLGNDKVDAMFPEERKVPLKVEGPAGDDGGGIRQRQRILERIDEPQKIVMLWMSGEDRKVLLADGQENARGQHGKGRRRGRKIGNAGPAVAGRRLPGCALERAKGDARPGAGLDRIQAHPGGERMGGVDHMGDPFRRKEPGKAGGPAKAADPRRQRLGDRRAGPAGVGKDRVDTSLRKMAGKLACFGGAAQKKDARHG